MIAKYDHVVTVWRHAELTGSALRDASRAWDPVASATRVGMSIQTARQRRADADQGEHTRGDYRGGGPGGMDVQAGDVVQVLEGPEAPLQLKVDSVRRPGGRHAELAMVEWLGDLS